MPQVALIPLLFLIMLLQLSSFFVLIFVGRRFPRQGDWLAVSATALSLIAAVFLLFHRWNQPVFHPKIAWFHLSATYSFTAGLLLDDLSGLMLVLVCFISLLVQVYSIVYMQGDRHYHRYFAYLNLFTFAMLGLVLADNLLLMYFFWELVGLCSYLLIGFWYDRPKAVAASQKAFLFNRVGDAGFLIGIILLYIQVGSVDFAVLFSQHLPDTGWMTLIGLCLFAGCVGKSAQFPLQTWLPDAMEGPTPVSALIHAATMVAAGIFLLARVFGLLTADALTVIAVIGSLTAFMGAYAALFQNDIKKVLAFSTVSQLGLMVMGMGVGAPGAALFHLFTHAFFKAGLFLCVGAVIHAVHESAAPETHLPAEYDTHDMRRMGGLRRKMPFTFICYLVAAAALAGIPLFSGFLSKEAILVGALAWAASKSPVYLLIPLAGLAATVLTAFYVGRQALMVFFGSWRGAKSIEPRLHEVSWLMKIPLALLALLSVGFWFSVNPLDGHQSWLLQMGARAEFAANSTVVALVSVLLSAIGLGLAYYQFWRKQALRKLDFRSQLPHIRQKFASDARAMQPWWFFYRLSINNWYLDQAHQRFLINPVLRLSSLVSLFDRRVVDRLVEVTGIFYVVLAHMVSWFDRTVVDGTVNGAVYLAGGVGKLTRSMQSGRVQTYFLLAILGLVFIAIWIILP